MLILTFFLCLTLFCTCSNGNGPDPNGTIKITNGMEYFPIQEGDFWSYNNGEIQRLISGDTIINGDTCVRVLQGGYTEEAWSLTEERFAQHLLLGSTVNLWFEPPLPISLNLEKDKPHDINSTARFVGISQDIASFAGTITFKGYESVEVSDVMLDSCLKLHYEIVVTFFDTQAADTSIYDEYYARGIGLVVSPDEEPMYLDSAVINGVKLP